MALVDSIDSHYQLVKSRLVASSSPYMTRGLMEAQDWPPDPIQENSFYLLTLKDSSINRQGYSATIPIKFHNIVWQWIVIGDELVQGERANNRGSRFRSLWAAKDALQQALFPGYTEKMSWALDGSGVFRGTSKTPPEFISWTPVDFHTQIDKDSGTILAQAMVRICDMTDPILA